MKTFLGTLPFLFGLVLCFGTTSCQTVTDSLSTPFGGKSGKSERRPVSGNYKKVDTIPSGRPARDAAVAGDSLAQGGPVDPSVGVIEELEETPAGVYRISTGDELIIDLLGIPEADRYEFILASDGSINLPLVGGIPSKGKTSEQLKNDIINLYVPDYYRNISVNVIIPSKPYYIQGEVNDAGVKRMEGRTSFTQAIAAAGGVSEYAHKNRVYVKRGGEQFEIDRKLINENPELDFEIFAGDVITVDETIW